jgi:aminoethylphosphonate catabolism LysR family transcriptional regulator
MYSSQLRAFHAVATHGGFTKAAEKLGLTQPALSDHVRKLERRFDVELFHRHKRTVTPTELGRRLLEITRRQFEMEDEAIELLKESQALKVGSLRIAGGAPLHIVKLIANFQKSYPGIRITLSNGNSDEVLRKIFDYSADIGELGQAPDDERLLVLPIRTDPIVAFVPKDHAWAERKKISLVELSREPMVLREVGSTTRHLVEAELRRLGVAAKLVMEVEGREAAREAVAAGIGVGVVSEPEFGHDERLVRIELTDCQASMTESLVCLKERANLRLIAAFLAAAQNQLT